MAGSNPVYDSERLVVLAQLVEHYTVNVEEEVHRFLKTCLPAGRMVTQTKPGLLTGSITVTFGNRNKEQPGKCLEQVKK